MKRGKCVLDVKTDMIFFFLGNLRTPVLLHISIHKFPLQNIKISGVFTFQTWNYHFKLFNILTASKPYYNNWWTFTSSSIISMQVSQSGENIPWDHPFQKSFLRFPYFDVTVVLSFPLLYIVLHHLIFTNVYHCSLYRSSLHVHPEFSDEINYLHLAHSSVSYIFNFLHYSMLCTGG